MAIILTTQTPPLPTPPDSHLPGVSVDSTVQPGGSGVAADSVNFTTLASVKWYVTAYTISASRFFEVSASAQSSRDPQFTLFGDTGDRLDLTVTVVQEPGKITLNIINNEVSDVALTVVRAVSVTV